MTRHLIPALRGAIGFLSLLPVGQGSKDWEAFGRTPTAFPLAGYVLGGLIGFPVAVAVALGVPPGSVAIVGLAAVYAVTGVNHLDGLLDLGDAAVVHGDPDDRVAVLKDTTVGVGAVAAAGIALVGLALAFLELGSAGAWAVLSVVVAAEVGAKLVLSGIACLGTARHEGLGEAFTTERDRTDLVAPVLVSLPAALPAVFTPTPLVGIAALAGACVGGGSLAWWADGLLGGVNGDVFGAANELARLSGLHLGVIAWTLS
ncbi:MAG: adenosylcobinamide-GDP ribazoletransferase [Haloferacaceae archaeon]